MARPAGHRLNRSAWEDILKLKGLLLTQVSELSEVPRPTLSALLGGHNRASVRQAHAIAEALEVSPLTLFPSLADDFDGDKKRCIVRLVDEGYVVKAPAAAA